MTIKRKPLSRRARHYLRTVWGTPYPIRVRPAVWRLIQDNARDGYKVDRELVDYATARGILRLR